MPDATDRPTPPAPGFWHPLEAIPVFVVAVVGGILLAAPALAVHSCVVQTIWAALAGEVAFALAVLLWVRYVNHAPLSSLGAPREPLKDVGLGVGGGLLLLLGAGVALTLVKLIVFVFIGRMPAEPQQVDACVRGTSVLALAPVVVLAAPIGEELFFRGFLYNGLRRRLSVLPSLLIASAAFGLVHIHPLLIPPLFVVGVGLALIYERRKSLLASMTAHATFNLIGVITIFVSRR